MAMYLSPLVDVNEIDLTTDTGGNSFYVHSIEVYENCSSSSSSTSTGGGG